MNTIRSGANWVEAKTKGTTAQAKKETNKSVAKDPNVRFSTRIRAAKDAMSATVDQKTQDRKADVHQQRVKHNY